MHILLGRVGTHLSAREELGNAVPGLTAASQRQLHTTEDAVSVGRQLVITATVCPWIIKACVHPNSHTSTVLTAPQS